MLGASDEVLRNRSSQLRSGRLQKMPAAVAASSANGAGRGSLTNGQCFGDKGHSAHRAVAKPALGSRDTHADLMSCGAARGSRSHARGYRCRAAGSAPQGVNIPAIEPRKCRRHESPTTATFRSSGVRSVRRKKGSQMQDGSTPGSNIANVSCHKENCREDIAYSSSADRPCACSNHNGQLRSPRYRERTSNRAPMTRRHSRPRRRAPRRATPDADRPLRCTWKIRVATVSS